jgi:hypothetical protein
MLRWVLLVLVIANAVFFSWSQGLWAAQGWAPARLSEPERMQQQVQAQAIRVLNSAAETADKTTEALTTDSVVPTEPKSCLWASGFSPGQADALRQAMGTLSLPEGVWSLSENRSPGRWIVYWGKFESSDVMIQRKATLRRLKIDHRDVTLPRLAPGLALGTFSNEDAAKEALSKVQAQGIRTARVAVERAETVNWALRLPAITEAQRQAIMGLGAALADKTLQACP